MIRLFSIKTSVSYTSKSNQMSTETENTAAVASAAAAVATAAAVKTPKGKLIGVCDFIKIDGNKCGKRCQDEHRCCSHRDRESYEKKCPVKDCPRMTKSHTGYCSQHITRAPKPLDKKIYDKEVEDMRAKLSAVGLNIIPKRGQTPQDQPKSKSAK
jgi:hypothetical protein